MRRIAGALSSHLHVFAIITLLLPRLARGASCGQTHTVASGEGCWSIYTDAKLTQAQFLGINPGLNCNVLAVGQQVCVAPACSKFYTVQSGDYCYKIESEQGISEADFMALNPGLACGEIFAGQRVCVAAPAASPTSTTSAGPSATSTTPSTTSAGSVTTSPTTVPSPTIVTCGRSRAVSQGDTCYDLASANGLQLSQFVALNDGLNCSALQAGDVACIGILCGQIYKVQSGDWCAKIESDWSLAPNQLTTLNPGLSCNDLAPQQNVCVEPAIIDNSVNNATIPAPDPYPALSPGGTVPQSPLLSFAAAEGNARSTFYGEVIFQSDYQHLTAFAHNDLNSDGKLDRDELQKMMSHDPKIVRGIGEINSTLTANNLVSEMLKTADRNGDGSIDRDEFLYAIRQVQNATNVVSELAADNTALGQQRKRIIPLVIAGIAAIIGLVIADVTLFFQLLARNELFQGNDLLSYLDITYWDGSGSAPSCSAYLYWSTNCGAIGSGHAKSCSKGGKRVFDNSCVTHAHSGSAGCGFLGCKSLCYDFNLENCDCDALKYKAERETEYTDTPASSTDETGVGACRKKCGGMNGCVGFSVSPGKSDTTLTCKVFKALSNKKSNSRYTTFRLVGSPVGSGGNAQCAPVEGTEFTHWPASVMADDIAFGEKLSDAYGSSSLRKRAPSSVDRRNNALYKTTIKNQNVISCGLCAPFSFTTTVEGTHKVWKKGYSDARDLSPVWVGRCKGGQSCDKGKQGGLQSRLLNAVGHNYIYSESCVPLSTVLKPDCSVSCGGRTLPYITGHKEWNFQHQEAPTVRRYIEEVKEWIANTGPVMANMCYNDAFTDYLSTLSTNSQDKVFWDNDPQWKSKACGTCNHAIVIVGYFEHKRPNTSKTRVVWIIQNSYGAFSGKGGYQFIEHGSAAMAAKPWFGVKVNEGRIHDET